MVEKHVVRYLKGTVEYGLKYEVNKNINLKGYVDSDWVGNAIDRKSRMESYMVLSIVKEKDVSTCYLGCSMFFFKLLFDLVDLTCIFV